MTTVKRFGIAALVTAALLSAAPAAQAAGVTTRGACSGVSKWKLDLRPQDGAVLRVTLEVEEGAAGQTWSVSMQDNATTFFTGTRTSGVGGAFRVRKTTADQPGTDTVVASATNQVTGEVCQAAATL